MADLIYLRRLDGRQIRVLELQPGSGSDAIHAALLETSIDETQPFEALSYVWGSASIREEIFCNGKPLQITTSLHAALRGLRHPTNKRLLWADAICINQDDLGERAHQVGHMGEIYGTAQRVVVWLGLEKEEDNVPLAIELMAAIYEACAKYAKAEGYEDLVFYANSAQAFLDVSDDQIDQTLFKSAEAWGAVRQFYDRPWFTRVWCVQEIVLARSSTILLGQRSLPWEVVGVVACWLGTQELETDFDIPSERADIAHYNAFCMFEKTQEMDETLEQALVRFRDFSATDPRDKVYALLGLVNQETDDAVRAMVVVDYTRAIWEVYADIAKISILRTGNLGVLSQVKHDIDYDRETTSFPSWVPRWDKSQECLALYSDLMLEGQRWNACGDYGIEEGFRPHESGIVELRGVDFDEVAWTSTSMTVDDFKEQAELPRRHPFVDIWNKCTSEQAPYWGVNDIIMSLAYTLSAGWTSEYQPAFILDAEEAVQFYADFLALIQHFFQASRDPAPTHDPEDYAFQDGDWKRFKTAASRACDERRFFRTARGNYGLGPDCLRPGDRVVVLHGGPVPYVLRPAKGGFWFLGEAYVNEIMIGEAFSDLKDTCSDERVFRLV